MRVDLSDLERLDGFAYALGRLFWVLMAVAFFAAILGSAGTGLLVLILGAVAFVVKEGLEDFVRSRRELTAPKIDDEIPITVHRTGGTGRPRHKTNSAV